jgi:hemoglobin|tara:strand:- start:3836 stop:4045 length:210 start_codon:yes stop_codon:yes gene_type:complete
MDVYTDLELPHDPEFASSLVGYLEWGTRLAVINSQPGAEVHETAPMPIWGWGETGGPYIPATNTEEERS